MDACLHVDGCSSAHRQVGHAIFGNLLGMLVEMMHVKFGLVWFEKKEDDLPTNSSSTMEWGVRRWNGGQELQSRYSLTGGGGGQAQCIG